MAKKKIGVILAGAVAKGAFEAGAIQALVERDVEIVRIVSASSGSLNGAFLAGAVRRGDARTTVEQLVTLWRDHAGLCDVFDVKVCAALGGRGISDQAKLRKLLTQAMALPEPGATTHPIELGVIVSPLEGRLGKIGPDDATTYERIAEFANSDFDTEQSLARVIDAAVASAAFPIAFIPAEAKPGFGPCIDGGVVNNTPVKHALEHAGSTAEAIVVIVPTVEKAAPPKPNDLRGTTLVGNLFEMLVNERLYRDLHDAEDVNTAYERLVALTKPRNGTPAILTDAQLKSVLTALKWETYRQVDIVRIRPLTPLRGNSFSGFVDATMRREYIDAGLERAKKVLDALGW